MKKIKMTEEKLLNFAKLLSCFKNKKEAFHIFSRNANEEMSMPEATETHPDSSKKTKNRTKF
jgi:hypothetical protein